MRIQARIDTVGFAAQRQEQQGFLARVQSYLGYSYICLQAKAFHDNKPSRGSGFHRSTPCATHSSCSVSAG